MADTATCESVIESCLGPGIQKTRKRLFKERGANATVHVRISVLLDTKMERVRRRVATDVRDIVDMPAE